MFTYILMWKEVPVDWCLCAICLIVIGLKGVRMAHNEFCRYIQAPPHISKPELPEFGTGVKPLKHAGSMDL